MDFENYWQENKRSLTFIGCGLLVFLIANTIVSSTFGGDLGAALSDRREQQRALGLARYDEDALDQADQDNLALMAARETLVTAVAFQTRPQFLADPSLGSVPAQYFTKVEQVRDGLSRRASRSGLRPPDDAWGIEIPKTSITPVIERHLQALDLIDRVANQCIDAGVARISRIQVRLDPGFDSKRGLGRTERTRVQFGFDTSSASMSRLIALTQMTEPHGQALAIEDFEIKGERNRPGHVKADVTFTIVRITETSEEDDA